MRLGNHLIFDFDTWTYDIAFAAEKDGVVRPFSYCVELIELRMRDIKERLACDTFSGYLTGKGNFRHQVATVKPYKGNRKKEKPHWYQAIRDHLVSVYGAVIVDGMEADDACAIEATAYPDPTKCIIVSRDKDLLQVPYISVYAYPLNNSAEMLHWDRSPLASFLCYLKQVVIGDSTDNYQGLPRKGDAYWSTIVAAAIGATSKTLDPLCKIVFNRVMYEYASHYGEEWKDRFLEQCHLAWMVRELDQDNKPILPTLEFSFYEQYYNFES